jgi:predicted ribosome quality control (RQC) complex YloA/Tae2 family protein
MIEKIINYQNHDYTVWIGQNSQDNWDIIDNASQNDIWFHVEGQPSCHVIINTNGETNIEKRVINHAAMLCKMNSKTQYQKRTRIIYTLIKNVRKCDKIGSVQATNTSIVVV